ncbi:E3 ubiquitin-protein ligase TRIM71-like [Mytilus edulis]|uniref:E3 ubiquitin-protein ligase TRIM71-like n=1 Tax=Mytilus edulis TaxID=6550 RepID=UPI0039EF1BA8
MASSFKHLCTICHDDGISNRAVTWCTECEVLFCEDCEKPHSKSRLSKTHKTLPAEHYHQLPTFMQEISSQCKDHNMKFELYCSFHTCPCCVQCVSDIHQKCQDLKALSDVLRHVKASASVQLLEKDLKDVKENLDTTIKYMKTRISTINTQKKIAVEEIRSMGKSINDYLTKLEQDILNDLESKHKKLILDMATILQQMEEQASQINQMQSQFSKMTQYSTELQMFIGLREVEKTTSQTAKYIEDLEIGDHFIEKNLQVNISSALQSILRDVKSFGDINIDTNSSTLQIKAGRKKQAQDLILKVPGIKQIKPSLLTRLAIPKDMMYLRIYACRILPDGKFIILDGRKNQLLLFGKDGTFIRIVATFSESPFDACFVRSNTVAVTLGLVHQTPLVDIEKNKSKIIQTIKLSHFCYGVASDGKNLVISSNNRHITTVNLDDMSHTIIERMEGVGRISLFQGNIYGTNYSGDKVCCYKSTGEPLWTFQHQDIGRPEGITIDMQGFVYIGSNGTNNVVVVSPDGQTSKTIISEADGIIRPYGIDVNKETKMIIVSSETRENSKTDYETAFVYTI